MKLILIRHGNALNHDIDALRALSDQGKSEAKETGLFLQNHLTQTGASPKKIIHSELLRAKETAMLVAGQLTLAPPLEEGKDLLPESSPSVWQNNALAFEEEDTIILVGHMPFMGIFASDLSATPMGLPTGGCVVFERQENNSFRLVDKNF